MEDDYELMPHKDISSLKKQLEAVKENPNVASSEGLKRSIEKLTDSLENMLVVFEEAAEEMKLEDKETEVISQKIEPLMDKLDEVSEQNKQIAKGIVAVADMIKDIRLKVPRETPKPLRAAPIIKREVPMSMPVQPTHPESLTPQPMRMPTPGPMPKPSMPLPPMSGPAMHDEDIPPPLAEKKGFMGMFKK